MSTFDQLGPERTVRILRGITGDLQGVIGGVPVRDLTEPAYIAVSHVAIVSSFLADVIEQLFPPPSERPRGEPPPHDWPEPAA